MKANALVLIKGVGRKFSGLYYVTRVVHRITHESYTQRFWVQRNGFEMLGSEDFKPAEAADQPRIQSVGGAEQVDSRQSGRVVMP